MENWFWISVWHSSGWLFLLERHCFNISIGERDLLLWDVRSSAYLKMGDRTLGHSIQFLTEIFLLPDSPALPPALMVLSSSQAWEQGIWSTALTLYSLTLANGFNPGSSHLGKCGEPLAHPKLNVLFPKCLPRLGKVQLSAQVNLSLSPQQCLAALSPGVALFRNANCGYGKQFLGCTCETAGRGLEWDTC